MEVFELKSGKLDKENGLDGVYARDNESIPKMMKRA
jgi:hypothetical protein